MDISQVSELKNWGSFCPTKATDPEKDAEFQNISFSSLRESLSMIQQGKMLARVPVHRLQHGHKTLTNPMAQICNDKDSNDAILDAVALHQSLVETVGEEKAGVFWKKCIDQNLGDLILVDFFPSAEDFLQFDDPFEALSTYMVEYFKANERGGLMRVEVVENSKDEFRVDVVECFFHSTACELGQPTLYSHISRGDDIFFPKLGIPKEGKSFAIYERQGTLCRGDKACDWRYHRAKD